MSNSGTGPWLPVYAATPQEKPPFLKYGILTVIADMLDHPWQHLITHLPDAGSQLCALGLATT